MNENELLEKTVLNLKDLVDSDAVIGKTIMSGGNVVIPVSRVTVGMVSGSGSGEKTKRGASEGLAGGAGGSVQPGGFLVIGNGVRFISVGKEEENKWLNLLSSAIDFIKSST